ncbi:MAG TPA: asparagine synthase-related protein [Vicinamibacterales bacterium]|nr:asparagine synthase-related protein [Vicinamibacterales bacterium]
MDGPPVLEAGQALDGAGAFARWRWNAPRLCASTDRFGIQPLFYAADPYAIRISPSVEELLRTGAPRDLDESALAVFLRVGFFVGDDTPFVGIRAAPPGGSLEWNDGHVHVRSGWTRPVASDASRDDAIDRFAAMFADSIERRLNATTGPVAVPLSGGHDSRHILFALCEAGCRPDRAVTVEPYPPSQADDVPLARALAERLGLPHVVVPRRGDRVAAESDKNALTSFCADEHVQFLPLRGHFERAPATLFDGLGGDVLSQSGRLEPRLNALFADHRVRDVAETILGDANVIEPALNALLTADARRRFSRERAVSRVAEEAAKYADDPNPIASFFAASRMRREIALAPCAMLDVATAVWLPFLDAPLASFLLGLPFGLVRDRRLHTDLLARRYPRFNGVPLDGKRQGRDSALQIRRDAVALMSRLARSRSRLVAAVPVAARAARAAASGRSAHLWFLPKIIHLLDVEQAAGTPLASLNNAYA